MIFLILLFIFANSQSREVIDNSQINCFIRHLKSLNHLDPNYPEYRARNEIQDCQLIVKKYKADIYKKTKNHDMPHHNECIQNQLRLENWADIHLKVLIFESSTKLSEEEKFKVIEELRLEINNQFKIASKFCMLEEEYGEIFEMFYNFDDMSERDKILFSCIQKYSVEHNLIKSYNMTIDHGNNSKCSEIIDGFVNDMEEGLADNLRLDKPDATQKEIDCSLRVYREEMYIQKLIATAVLGKLNLNESQKLREKRNFIKFMTLITQNIQNCFYLEHQKITH